VALRLRDAGMLSWLPKYEGDAPPAPTTERRGSDDASSSPSLAAAVAGAGVK
jgi:hypothetical protein